ncbi:hypothetical protein [Streptomyces sp. NPDC052179]|uniref:hypothetical protein n=1 Tax=Streptomyces sp. NPDC052179 TaxID=3155680 RepID=UPI00344673DB
MYERGGGYYLEEYLDLNGVMIPLRDMGSNASTTPVLTLAPEVREALARLAGVVAPAGPAPLPSSSPSANASGGARSCWPWTWTTWTYARSCGSHCGGRETGARDSEDVRRTHWLRQP